MNNEHKNINSEKVRRQMKRHDDIELPMNDEFFERLHDKIMAEVNKTAIEPIPLLAKQKNMLRAHWRGWLYPTGGLMAVLLIGVLLVNQESQVTRSMQRVGLLSDGHERIAAEALLAPEELSQTLISTQSEADFFMDVAQDSFEHLTVAKFNKILGEKKTN